MGRVTSQAAPRSQLFYAVVWLATTLLLVAILQVVTATEAFGDGDAGTITPASDFPLAGVELDEKVDGPSAVYAGQLWTVHDARATHAEGLLARASVEVDVTVTNTLAASAIRIPDSAVGLVDRDGAVVDGARFVGHGLRLSLEPGESIEVTIAFEVGFTQTPDLDELTLTIGEPNRIPATVPLDGSAPEIEAPVFAAVEADAKAITDPDDASRQIVVEPAGAAVDINAGPYRAVAGERLAVVKVSVQRAGSGPDAGYLDPAFWALETTSGTIPAILAAPSDEPSNTDEVTLLFSFPESDELRLVAGADGSDATTFSLVLPA
ncbi:MAG: hypothetical protein ACFCVK_00655 [Acidimicrobiales bacterium]